MERLLPHLGTRGFKADSDDFALTDRSVRMRKGKIIFSFPLPPAFPDPAPNGATQYTQCLGSLRRSWLHDSVSVKGAIFTVRRLLLHHQEKEVP
jgi:hypothetical protein